MSTSTSLPALSENEVRALRVFPSRPVNLRRDIFKFIQYVQNSGLTRTFRENTIPKSAARKLARILSHKEEPQIVEKTGMGDWSNYVSYVALRLGLVSFNVKGVYQGYSSSSESFPENDVTVNAKAWKAYLDKSPTQKERAILDVLVEDTPNEFFHRGTLVECEVFSTCGSAVGPASKMKLPKIRRKLLALLAELSPNVWYETRGLVELLQSRQPSLILDAETREPDPESSRKLRDWKYDVEWGGKGKKLPKPEVKLEDIYANFREFDASLKESERYSHGEERKITSRTPGAFHRVEGRYLEWFLREIPYIAGFVDLAYRPEEDPHGRDVSPAFEQLRAFRLTPWFFMVMGADPLLERVTVTVMPNFEVIVEAPSYPEIVLESLAPYCVSLAEDGPIHKLRLDRKTTVETAATDGATRPAAEVLAKLAGRPLPSNVKSELGAWLGRAEKLTFFDEELGLLEMRGEEADRVQVLADLGGRVVDDRIDGFVLVRDPGKVFRILEERHHVPLRVRHQEQRFSGGGVFEDTQPGNEQASPAKKPLLKAQLEREDLVGYRCSNRELLAALLESLQKEATTCLLAGREGEEVLVISAASVPRLRTTLRRLSDRFEIQEKAGRQASAGAAQ